MWDSDIQWRWQALSAHQKYRDQPDIPCQVTSLLLALFPASAGKCRSVWGTAGHPGTAGDIVQGMAPLHEAPCSHQQGFFSTHLGYQRGRSSSFVQIRFPSLLHQNSKAKAPEKLLFPQELRSSAQSTPTLLSGLSLWDDSRSSLPAVAFDPCSESAVIQPFSF